MGHTQDNKWGRLKFQMKNGWHVFSFLKWEKLKIQMKMVECFLTLREVKVFRKLGCIQDNKWGRLKYQMKMVEMFLASWKTKVLKKLKHSSWPKVLVGNEAYSGSDIFQVTGGIDMNKMGVNTKKWYTLDEFLLQIPYESQINFLNWGKKTLSSASRFHLFH